MCSSFLLVWPCLCPHVEVSFSKAVCTIGSFSWWAHGALWGRQRVNRSMSRRMQICWEARRILQVIQHLPSLNCNNYAVFPSMRRKTDRRSFLSQKYAANGVKRELRDEKEQDGICGVRAETLVGVNRPSLTDAVPCRSSTRQHNAFPGSIIKYNRCNCV